MKTYLICAYDSNYGDDAGMTDWDITTCFDYSQAEEIAQKMGYDVITSYEYNIDEIEDEVRERLSEEGINGDDLDYDKLFSDWFDDLVHERIEYQIYELKPDVNYRELDLANMNWEDIRDTYSIDCV